MKIGVISDLHLGFRQYGSIEREQDFYNQFESVCQKINEEKVDMVIIAGDLFNTANPTPIAINSYRHGIGCLDADIVCTIKGNHTMVLRDGHYSIDDFFGEDEFSGYFLLDDSSMDTKTFALSGGDIQFGKYKNTSVCVDGITYRSNSNIEEFLEVQKKLAEQKSDKFFNILVVHQSFKEFCGFTGEELSIEDIDYAPYDIIICGHIHSRYDKILSDGTVFIQPGSIERMNKTEALDEIKNQKGFYIIDTTNKDISFHPVECERKFFIGEKDIHDVDEIKKFYDELSEEASKLNLPPIISYDFHNYTLNMQEVRYYILDKKENILLDNSNISDEIEMSEVDVENFDKDVPTIFNLLQKKAKEHLNEKDAKFAADLFSLFKNNSDEIKDFMDNYLEKRKKIEEEKFDLKKSQEEIKKLEEFFNNL